MAKKKKKDKKTLADQVWDTFERTGELGFYLLYRNLNGNGNNNGNDLL